MSSVGRVFAVRRHLAVRMLVQKLHAAAQRGEIAYRFRFDNSPSRPAGCRA
jgi:hypothetical protein